MLIKATKKLIRNLTTKISPRIHTTQQTIKLAPRADPEMLNMMNALIDARITVHSRSY